MSALHSQAMSAPALIERIDLLRNVIVYFSEGRELPGLSHEELVAYLQHTYAVQQKILASAPAAAQVGYLSHLKRIHE